MQADKIVITPKRIFRFYPFMKIMHENSDILLHIINDMLSMVESDNYKLERVKIENNCYKTTYLAFDKKWTYSIAQVYRSKGLTSSTDYTVIHVPMRSDHDYWTNSEYDAITLATCTSAVMTMSTWAAKLSLMGQYFLSVVPRFLIMIIPSHVCDMRLETKKVI